MSSPKTMRAKTAHHHQKGSSGKSPIDPYY
jgi:hypothetical protein